MTDAASKDCACPPIWWRAGKFASRLRIGMKVRSAFLAAMMLLGAVAPATGLPIVKIGSVSEAALHDMASKIKDARIAVPTPSNGVDLYKITYPSRDAHGNPATLSGLVMLPTSGTVKGLLLYCHASTFERQFSPSRFTGTDSNSESGGVMLAFAAGGYAVAIPDYLGWGDDNTVHP